MQATPRPSVSIIIPARDEAGAIGGLLAEIAAGPLVEPFEIIVVDDGSTDGTGAVVLGTRLPSVRLLTHAAPAGKSRAIRNGALAARGEIIVTVDGDGQNDPQFLAALVAPLAAAAVALVAGQRTRRHDGLPKRLGSRLANAMRRAMLADDTRDTACGLKAMRRSAYLSLPYFDNNHRFLPALFLREGFGIAHVEVEDRPRAAGRSKYGLLDRALVGLPDLIGVWWLRRRAKVVPEVSRTAAHRAMEPVDE